MAAWCRHRSDPGCLEQLKNKLLKESCSNIEILQAMLDDRLDSSMVAVEALELARACLNPQHNER